MAQYIPKAALVAEIDRRILGDYNTDEEMDEVARAVLASLKFYICTLETKWVDLEIEQRMKECPYRQVVCTMYESKILECKGACSWVVDYPKLKELKAQEGE